uniref:Uncharacterized protein n=1 Tax=Anguilla anguilla TaxID=7936 RepID=A0A0E9T1H1_ANGAN
MLFYGMLLEKFSSSCIINAFNVFSIQFNF